MPQQTASVTCPPLAQQQLPPNRTRPHRRRLFKSGPSLRRRSDEGNDVSSCRRHAAGCSSCNARGNRYILIFISSTTSASAPHLTFLRFRQRLLERPAATGSWEEHEARAQVNTLCPCPHHAAVRLTLLQPYSHSSGHMHRPQGLLQRGGDHPRGSPRFQHHRHHHCPRNASAAAQSPPPPPQVAIVSLATGLLLSLRFLLSAIAKSEQVARLCNAFVCRPLIPPIRTLPLQLLPSPLPARANKSPRCTRQAEVLHAHVTTACWSCLCSPCRPRPSPPRFLFARP